MTCLFCKHGQTHQGTTTITLARDRTTVVFKDVPADVCDTCGEAYVADDVSAKLLAAAADAVSHGVEVDIRRYAA